MMMIVINCYLLNPIVNILLCWQHRTHSQSFIIVIKSVFFQYCCCCVKVLFSLNDYLLKNIHQISIRFLLCLGFTITSRGE